jgi:hypothetical protein
VDPRLLDQTRREWRQLGFFYDWSDERNEWRIVGTRSGLSALADRLRLYASNPRNAALSEHEHLGPYMYLKITTARDRRIDADGIHGSLSDVLALATLIQAAVEGLDPSRHARICSEFSTSSLGGIRLELRPDGFDPASVDDTLAR